jgi:hypothetical protein
MVKISQLLLTKFSSVDEAWRRPWLQANRPASSLQTKWHPKFVQKMKRWSLGLDYYRNAHTVEFQMQTSLSGKKELLEVRNFHKRITSLCFGLSKIGKCKVTLEITIPPSPNSDEFRVLISSHF